MAHSYILWALLGMAGYSLITLFVKLAERSGSASTYMVLAVSTTIVSIFPVAVVAMRGELKPCSSIWSGRRCSGRSPEA
jgi:transporter family protein